MSSSRTVSPLNLLNSTTNWGPSVEMLETMTHSNHAFIGPKLFVTYSNIPLRQFNQTSWAQNESTQSPLLCLLPCCWPAMWSGHPLSLFGLARQSQENLKIWRDELALWGDDFCYMAKSHSLVGTWPHLEVWFQPESAVFLGIKGDNRVWTMTINLKTL